MNAKTNPLNESQLAALEQVTHELTPEQILWLSGYLEGRLAGIQPNDQWRSCCDCSCYAG
jgi:sulfite reductase (NADPH) flavoprotein alpha-component